MFKKFVLRKIRHYQKEGGGEQKFSVDCNFIPSCSEYSIRAIEYHGLCKGGLLSLKRISRCNQRDLVEKIKDEVPMKNYTYMEIFLNRHLDR